jgi:hypothetical protein
MPVFDFRSIIMRADPEFARDSRNQIEYEFSAHGMGDPRTQDGSRRVFRGDTATRGPYAPRDEATILLSGTATLPESAPRETLVGLLSIEDGTGVYTLSLSDDAGGRFAIVGNRLIVNSPLDYESFTSHVVEVTIDNGFDTPVTQQFTITVTDVVEVDGMHFGARYFGRRYYGARYFG